MLTLRRPHFKNLILFMLAVSFCLLFHNLSNVDVAQSQVLLIKSPSISVVTKEAHIKTSEIVNFRKQTDKEHSAKTLIDKAQSYNDLGQFRFSIPLLKQAISISQESNNQKIIIVAQGVLGNAYILAGQYDEALKVYQTSLELAEKIGNEKYITIALNGQVSIRLIRQKKYLTQVKEAQVEKDSAEVARISALAEQELNAAKELSNRALQISQTVGGIPQVKALLNGIKLFSEEDLITRYQQQALSILNKLPPSRSKAYVLIQLAEYQVNKAKVDNLEKATTISKGLGDLRTQSFALGGFRTLLRASRTAKTCNGTYAPSTESCRLS